MSDFVLEMKGITKIFPGVRALDDVSLKVKNKQIHGLIGENGAGKSTLMKVLMGIYHAEEGKLFINGSETAINSPTDAILKGIGMVPQELNLNPFVSAAENIFLGNEIKNCFGKIDWKETNRRAKIVMDSINLDINPNEIVHKLSSAQQQLVQLSRVLATGAQLLVFDEPTASLTQNETDSLLTLMKKLKDDGKTIIFISHHLEELLSTTDQITVMRDGKVVSVEETSRITIDGLIEKMAGKKVEKQIRTDRMIPNEIAFKVEGFSRPNEFENISFEVRKGEIFGIGGLVGSGRTELISAIYGIKRKKHGKLYIEGKEIDIKTPADAVKCGIGFVPEERRANGIFPIMSVRENLIMSIYDSLFHKGKINKNQSIHIANEFIQKINIKTPSTETTIRNLSGGNQQKVILARWLAKGVKFLFLDEPTRGIDVNAKGEIYALIRQMTELGMTVIIVSSEHEELLLLTDRMMIMHEGKNKGLVETSEIEQHDILEIALK